MAVASTTLFALVFLLAVITPLVLYYLVRTEHSQRTTMTREDAEKTARQDTQDRGKR